MKIGIDIIELSNLKKRIKLRPGFIERILSIDELADSRVEKLAGKIAAKEAVIKTGFIKPGDWLKIKIINIATGQPLVFDKSGKKVPGLTVSISHSKNTAVAVALYDRK